MFDLSHITEAFFPEYSPLTINEGRCFNWAYAAFIFYKNHKVRFYTAEEGGGHAFIQIDNKYYDAEHPRGVAHWSKLSFFVAYQKVGHVACPYKQSLKEFLFYWRNNGYDKLWTKKFITKRM